ncbi:hypothetical protein [Emticicia sp. 21SJ11W-3]|uniref:hypothetical protein n=1 Tax=Emticicia sp. 21SJ11W-3 TaxID=2916755 RepID=UPI00209FD03B|nr:hypothetical protein [Emticicia sp. 21SJ11W-3]UTA67901.1 hypothetical protein MB380_20235 [Emticicia sp. 21SJ11W-3]
MAKWEALFYPYPGTAGRGTASVVRNEELNIEKWEVKLGINENKKTRSLIEQHKVWCELARITKIKGTPTMYLDGLKIPEIYRLKDLKGILKYLPTRDLQINHKQILTF